MARVGFALGYGKFTNAREIAGLMQQAEERGYEMGFFSETIELMRDSVTALAAIGLATKRLVLGSTQIVRLRGPVVMAQTLASLDELTGGRMTLAPGACTKSHARVHSLATELNATPAEVLKEYIESMRLLLTGEKVSYHGKYVNFDNVGLPWKPARNYIPLYVPATSKTGLRLAGQIGDGVVLNAVCSPEYTENALKIIKDAAEAAGRDWSKFEVAQLINCSVEDNHKKALDEVRWALYRALAWGWSGSLVVGLLVGFGVALVERALMRASETGTLRLVRDDGPWLVRSLTSGAMFGIAHNLWLNVLARLAAPLGLALWRVRHGQPADAPRAPRD